MDHWDAFAAPGFSPAAYVNQMCTSKPASEPAERYLAELEMRLQLAAEEIEATLQDSSTAAMRRIPFAVQEIYRLQGDAQGLQDQARQLSRQAQRDASEGSHVVEGLVRLGLVRKNVELACSTLREATELSSLLVRVEEVFAAGDLLRAAEVLASMRRSLSAVGDVPEFRAGRQRLRSLEDRLQSEVEGALATALAKGPASGPEGEQSARQLCGLLLAVDRYNAVERLFVNARLQASAPLGMLLASVGSDVREDAPGEMGLTAAAVYSIQRLYSQMAPLLEAEAAWCGRLLPLHQGRLLAALAAQVFEALAASARSLLERTGVRSFAPLAGLQRDAAQLAKAAAELLQGAASSAIAAASSTGTSAEGDAGAGAGAADGGSGEDASMAAAAQRARATNSMAGVSGGAAAAAAAAAAVASSQQVLQHAQSAVALVLAPVEAYVEAYVELERSELHATLRGVLAQQQQQQQAAVGGSAADVAESYISALSTALAAGFAAFEAAVEHCITFTGGSELAPLVRVLDQELGTFISSCLAGSVNALSMALGLQAASAGASGAAATALASFDEEALGSVMRLVLASTDAAGRLNALDAAVRTSAAAALPQLEAAAAAAAAATKAPERQQQQPSGRGAHTDAGAGSSGGHLPQLQHEPLALRMRDHPAKLQALRQLVASLRDPRFLLLSLGSTELDGSTEAAHTLVLDALLVKVRAQLRLLPSLKEWRQRDGGGMGLGLGGSLPSFNAYPSQVITAVGEYLMTLPQQLEVLIVAAEEQQAAAAAAGSTAPVQPDQGEELAAHWLDKSVTAAAALYLEQALALGELSSRGGAQLAADAEYLANVLSALHVAPPLQLLTLQLYAGQEADVLSETLQRVTAEGGGPEAGADLWALRALAAMRGLAPAPSAGARSTAGQQADAGA